MKDETPYPKPITVTLFAIGIVLLLFSAVYIFTRNSFISGFNISSSKGEIGDAVNGITAPITSLIGAGLIFYSFLAQLEANKLQLKANALIQSQWQFDSFTKTFNDVQTEISNLKYTLDSNAVYLADNPEIAIHGIGEEASLSLYHGSEAIIVFSKNFENHIGQKSIGIMNDIAFILEELCGLINDIENSNMVEERKKSLFFRINRLYVAKLQAHLSDIQSQYKVNVDKVNMKDDSAQPYYISMLKRIQDSSVIMRKGFGPTNVTATIKVD
jgi:hypothetical protein